MQNPMLSAIRLAKKSEKLGDVPVGCIILDSDGSVVSSAQNSMIKSNDPTAHAEILAIRKACKKKKTQKLDGLTLYVTLEPCRMCEAAIYEVGIRKVFFGSYTGSYEIFNNLKKKYNSNKQGYQFLGGIEENKCNNLLKSFFKKLR